MKRFGKYRDPRFALTTLQNPTWEVRTRAELSQAAQEALADQPDVADISAPPLAAAPLLPPITTSEPDIAEFLETAPVGRPEPLVALASSLPAVPDVVPVARPVPKVVAKPVRKPRSKSKPRAKKPVQPSVVLPAGDAAPFVSKTLDRLITKAAKANRHEHSAPASVDRHERKCAICHHPQRADLEEDFLDWRNPELLRKEYEIPNYRTIYRHARATGLYQRRRENLRFAAELLVEEVDNVRPGPDTVLRAINTCARLNDRGEWIEPVKRVIVSSGGQITSFAPTFQPAPAPEQHQLAPESCANPQFTAPVSTSTDGVTPQFLIDVPAIRK
jgi:hypothetical protein